MNNIREEEMFYACDTIFIQTVLYSWRDRLRSAMVRIIYARVLL